MRAYEIDGLLFDAQKIEMTKNQHTHKRIHNRSKHFLLLLSWLVGRRGAVKSVNIHAHTHTIHKFITPLRTEND